MFSHCLLIACVCVASIVPAHQSISSNSWTGKKIVLTKPGLQIRGNNENGNKDANTAELIDFVYLVVADKNNRLKIWQGNVEGWVDKKYALLLDDGIRYYTKQISVNPNDHNALAARGVAKFEKELYDQAIDDLSEAIGINPKVSSYWGTRGLAYGRQMNYSKAIDNYNEAIRLTPADSLIYYNRGVAYTNMRQFDKAVSDFSEAIRLNKSAPWLYCSRGFVYQRTNEYEKAILDYTEAIRLDPQDAAAFSDRGVAHKCVRKYEKAILDYTEAIRLDPKDTRALSNAAWLLATCPIGALRDGKRAVEYATNACELTKWKDGTCVEALAAAYADLGRFDKATMLLLRAIDDRNCQNLNRQEGKQRLELYKTKSPFREN